MNRTTSRSYHWPTNAAVIAVALAINASRLYAEPDLTPQAVPSDLQSLQEAVSPDDAVAKPAWAQLRSEGPAGLEHLRSYYGGVIAQNEPDRIPSIFDSSFGANSSTKVPNTTYLRIREAECAIGAQYDNINGLYWYTDLAAAEAAAQAAHKPILSLRLLGKLDEKLTCANSRFFRITLYANREVAQLLKDKFILHWETFRPVPIVTIDFGDGRKLVRTVTGNSIHYIVSPEGDLVDALPGLYGPATFLSELNALASVATEPSPDHFYSYREKALANVEEKWRNELVSVLNQDDARLAILQKPLVSRTQLVAATDDQAWNKMATRLYPVSFDSSSTALIATKFPTAKAALPLAISKNIVEDPVVTAIRGLETSTALDTVKNDLSLRSQILQLSMGVSSTSHSPRLDTFNDDVYAEVFLTPKDDPYLGLEAPGCISGIDGGGEVSMGK